MTAFAICNNVTPVVDDPEVDRALEVKDPENEQAITEQPRRESEAHDESTGRTRPRKSDARERRKRGPESGTTKMLFQGSSPDEVALVKYANAAGLELIERDRTNVQLRNCLGLAENYEILANFPFSSESKKMSILVRHKESGKAIYYVKGAEIVIESMVSSSQRGTLLEFCDTLATDGLRTLAFAQKLLSPQELEQFMNDYQKAQSDLIAREQSI